MKLAWLLPVVSLLLFGGTYIFLRSQSAQNLISPPTEFRPLPSREALEKLGRAKVDSSKSSGASAAAPVDIPGGNTSTRTTFPYLSDRFYFPPPNEKDTYVNAVLEKIKAPLSHSKYWTTNLTVRFGGEQMPATLLLILYDSNDRRSAEPLRTVPSPKYLAWTLVGYFGKPANGSLIKWNTSSVLENIPRLDNSYYLFLSSADHDELKKKMEYLVLPLPLQSSGSPQFLVPGGKWIDLPKITWEPVTEVVYRIRTDDLDHASR